MKKVLIIFPDTNKLVEFLLMYKVSNAEVNSNDVSLLAPLTESEIIAACTKFEGTLHFSHIPSNLNYNNPIND